MAPVRRYLRITKYSVLECRIYLDNPSLAQSWLLNPRNPVLPRVIESIRHLVIPKLREEKERSKKKSTKKKALKDVVVEDDFEVSVFLTETNTRHSLLTKHKHFRDKGPSLMQSNSSKLISETNANPIDVEAYDTAPIRPEEDSDDDGVRLGDIPLAALHQQAKRQRGEMNSDGDFEGSDEDNAGSAIEIDSDTDQPPQKRHRGPARSISTPGEAGGDGDSKKKLAMDVSYEGFAIYGRVLCLVVRKREAKSQQTSQSGKDAGGSNKLAGQARMENWITSTQIPVGEEVG
ncbi:hypothetical protein PT974_06117 [Cladobotryum mycophilum]|uniref:Uncharacterized protein n=1 Tax=Cladobotryum mycophilum TaxID=491253 RepID=A0ABR0SLC7_9HYPO